MQLFHASPFKFEHFTLDHLGQGEGGTALGLGLYLSEEFKVAERVARYLRSRTGTAYLYTVTLHASQDEILDLAKHWNKTVDHARWGRIDYPKMLNELGYAGAFEKLIEMGIKAVRDYEEDDRGHILLCVQPQHLRIDGCEPLESV